MKLNPSSSMCVRWWCVCLLSFTATKLLADKLDDNNDNSNKSDDEFSTALESEFSFYENIHNPEFVEPITMTEMRSKGGDAKTFLYRYPKTTGVIFKAFNRTFKILLQRRDAVFAGSASMSDYHPEDSDTNFLEDEDTTPTVLSSVCIYDAHFTENSYSYSGMMSLCDQRLDGILRYNRSHQSGSKPKNRGYRIWTSENNDDDTKNKDKVGYRIASLDAKSSSKGFLDLSMDGEEDIDESLLGNVTKSFDDLKNDRNRWRLATNDVMDSTIKTRYVELYILADEALEASHGHDRQRVNQKIASIVAMMNSLYKPLNIEFLVQHIKYGFSTDQCSSIDQSSASAYVKSYLDCVANYRVSSSCQEPNGPMKKSDHTMLVTGRKFCDSRTSCVLGMAKIYTICSWDKSVSISSAPASSPVWEVGLTISHELGHSFGAMHDWNLPSGLRQLLRKQGARPAKGCTCTLPDGSRKTGKTRQCIMSPMIDNQLSWSWSDCSFADIDFTKEANLHSCLFNRLDKYESVERLLQSSCGNGKLDPGEQCENQGTGCCTGRCVLRKGAECNYGPCCTKDCKLKPAGTVCDAAEKDSCDEDDVCTGKSFECQILQKPNGSPCRTAAGDSSHCYRGSCRGRTEGCQDLLGSQYIANEDLMKNPLGDGEYPNGCVAKPCAYQNLPARVTRKTLLKAVFDACVTDEDSVCGNLFCSPKRRKREAMAGDELEVDGGSLRSDLHRVMSDRFGAKKWKRMMTHSGMVDDQTAGKFRQDSEKSLKEHMDMLQRFSGRTVWKWGDGSKFVYFPIHSNNPAMAPSGSSCGKDGKKMCHNGRCLSLSEFRSVIWDPADDPLAVIPEAMLSDSDENSASALRLITSSYYIASFSWWLSLLPNFQ